MITETLRVEINGIELQLLADRGIYLPSHRTLLVADTHFGKEATFRRHCIPVPRGTTDATLAVITQMISATEATRLIFLGDMFHHRSSLSGDVRRSLDAFFQRHPQLDFWLTLGNHDQRLGCLPASWPLDVFDRQQIDRIGLAHHPIEVPEDVDLLLCGHLHPAIRIETAVDSLGKLPCFWLSERRLVLPAIGEFTGTHRVRPAPKDRIWLVADGNVIEYRSKPSDSTIAHL